MPDQLQITPSTARPAAVIRLTIPRDQIMDAMGAGYSDLMDAVAAQGLETCPDLWEIYQVGPESGADPAAWSTELNKPLA